MLTYPCAILNCYVGFVRKQTANQKFDMAKFIRRYGIDYEAHTVYGEYVDIIAGLAFGVSDVDTLVGSMKYFLDRNSTLVAQAISDTINPLDAAVNSSESLFSIVGYFNLGLSIVSVLFVVAVLRKFCLIQRSFVVNYCSTALLMTLVANVLRVLRSVDFAGWRGSFEYTVARLFITVPPNLGVSCFILVSFFWFDSTTQITHALNMKFVTPPRPWVRHCLVLLSLLLVALDILAFLLFENLGRASNVPVVVVLTYCGVFLLLSGLTFVVSTT
jgi:hypothetical protein